ncbi:glutamate synthase-related protein [Peribacillus sp. NPDC055009]
MKDIKKIVNELRSITGGVPIGVKMGAGGKIEEDIDHLLNSVLISLRLTAAKQPQNGALLPILSDDMGIPTLHAVVWAVNHLETRKMKGQISLIVSEGLIVPGHFLKVLALGADAVYVGSAILFAVSHSQALNALPFEPPTQDVWNQDKFKDQFKIEDGVNSREILYSKYRRNENGIKSDGETFLKGVVKKRFSFL